MGTVSQRRVAVSGRGRRCVWREQGGKGDVVWVVMSVCRGHRERPEHRLPSRARVTGEEGGAGPTEMHADGAGGRWQSFQFSGTRCCECRACGPVSV